MLVTLIALFAVAMVAPWIFRFTGREGFYVLAAVPAAGFVWLLTRMPDVFALQSAIDAGADVPAQADGLVREIPWVPFLDISLSFRMDALSAFMSLIVLGVGALVLAYCARYFREHEAKDAVFGGQLLAFAGAMFGLVTTDDLMVLYTFWEITSVLSFLLIGYAGQRIFARRSAIQALIVTTFGGLAMLVGLLMLGVQAGSWKVSGVLAAAPELLADPALRGYAEWAVALVLIGALTKSAQIPFHFWLPAAMAAPTPVSAYLHAAAMVKAGVFLVARLAPAYAGLMSWQVLVTGVGLATLLVGGYRALRQTDIKLVLAYGTVSQLGFLMVANGFGTRDAAMAGLAMLIAHALFKAPLFMVVGIIDHETGTRDVRTLSGIGRGHPVLAGMSAVAAASMAGLPPLFGFVAKESVLEAAQHTAEHHGTVWAWVPLVVLSLGSVLTVAYTCRFLWGAFATKHEKDDAGTLRPVPATAFRTSVTALEISPSMVLTALCVAMAFVPGPIEKVITAHTGALDPLDGAEEPAHLALWHGLTPILALSAAIIGLGLLLAWQRTRVEQAQEHVQFPWDASKVYQRIIYQLDALAVWVTGRTQTGSLSTYLGIILTVALGLPLYFMVFPAGGHERPLATLWRQAEIVVAEDAAQAFVVLAIVVGTVAAVKAHRRFMAALLVAITGYGAAAIFAFRGAPDLAITQVLVETIVLVTLVLGLRSLPASWDRRTSGHGRRWPRVLIAVSFALVMMWVAATALAARTAAPISVDMPELAYANGYGSNVVNVTLVDIRAWDTWGEITVLAAAATGVVSLVFLQHRDRRGRALADVKTGSVGRITSESAMGTAVLSTVRRFAVNDSSFWLEGGRTLAPERRSIVFEVITRLMFHPMVLFSLYLLLAGHNSPGGGFAGGLMAGLALTLRYLAGGRYELQNAIRVPSGVLLGAGLALASLTGLFPLFFGGQVLQSAHVEFHDLFLLGDVKLVTATVFDIGVYLVVIGLVLDVLRSLGSEIDRRGDEARMAREKARMHRRRRHHRAGASGAVAGRSRPPVQGPAGNGTPTTAPTTAEEAGR
ncbi:Na+/H+ antiporter subunit A [Micrococcus lylae]|uniref:Na+/H+ antiporter subunit A n=1 Tax=Micrococcus lylae TaxID=1273 RepID=UPI000C80EC2A|nr:Na+/H+ antiporter subunit A [Micrococcus lylae]WIK81376.1 Na+/H+ antiporter subunit A [Micrococcus lylae]